MVDTNDRVPDLGHFSQRKIYQIEKYQNRQVIFVG